MCPDDRPAPSRPALATRVVATLCGTVAIGIPLLAFELAAVVVYGLRCDEACGGSGWGDPTAWQWHAQFWGFEIVHPVLQLSGLAYFAGDRSDWPFLAVWLMTIGGAITIGGETAALRRWR